MAERSRQVGWRGVLIVGALAVAAVLGAQLLTYVLPADVQQWIYGSPLVVGVLIVGTALVLWRIAASRPPEP